VKILIEMAPEHYDGLLNSVGAQQRPEYRTLKNGVVVDRQIEGEVRRVVEVVCDESVAQKLLATAESLRLPVVVDIRKALDPLRDL
jgi:hypothetical protein